ncbi:hypothetical protein GGE65_007713 [Skermanella aerolata]|uniref:hypothetical protein n=1 Tax=Skermanella aerolata TaxID=393310 RepID=UPI003D231A05
MTQFHVAIPLDWLEPPSPGIRLSAYSWSDGEIHFMTFLAGRAGVDHPFVRSGQYLIFRTEEAASTFVRAWNDYLQGKDIGRHEDQR